MFAIDGFLDFDVAHDSMRIEVGQQIADLLINWKDRYDGTGVVGDAIVAADSIGGD